MLKAELVKALEVSNRHIAALQAQVKEEKSLSNRRYEENVQLSIEKHQEIHNLESKIKELEDKSDRDTTYAAQVERLKQELRDVEQQLADIGKSHDAWHTAWDMAVDQNKVYKDKIVELVCPTA